LLAMVENDNAGFLNECSAPKPIASKLAPTRAVAVLAYVD
jgi:hypothetical protein